MIGNLIACHECDLLHRIENIPVGDSAKCHRCGAVMYRNRPDSLNRTLALTVAGLILFLTSNAFPFLSFRMQAQITETLLLTGVVDLYHQGMWQLSLLVLLTTILVPAIQIAGLLYVLVPLRFGHRAPKLAMVFRFITSLRPWGMMEVFLLGILVSVVKLSSMATIVPGIAIWAFGLLIPVLAAASVTLDPQIVWKQLDTA